MPDQKFVEKFKVSLNNRQFEIELFWKRSLFFWGIIASAFIGFAALKNANSNYSVIVATFGMISSFIWSLANRGSKYWQEYWENKVAETESEVTGPISLGPLKRAKEKDNRWLRARRYSVSKLAIALSDYVTILWIGIVLWETCIYLNVVSQRYSQPIIIGFLIISSFYMILILFYCRSSTATNL